MNSKVDRDNFSQVVPMEVLSLGISHTGTRSMKEAVTELGYGLVYHGFEVATRPRDGDVFEVLTQRKFGSRKAPITRRDLNKIYAKGGAVTDMPSVAFLG